MKLFGYISYAETIMYVSQDSATDGSNLVHMSPTMRRTMSHHHHISSGLHHLSTTSLFIVEETPLLQPSLTDRGFDTHTTSIEQSDVWQSSVFTASLTTKIASTNTQVRALKRCIARYSHYHISCV